MDHSLLGMYFFYEGSSDNVRGFRTCPCVRKVVTALPLWMSYVDADRIDALARAVGAMQGGRHPAVMKLSHSAFALLWHNYADESS